MDSPLPSPRTEICGTSETCRTMLPSPPPLDANETNWIVHVNNNLKCMPTDEQQYWKNPSIYRVPASITNLNREAYQPQVVSFGPYHHGEIHLHPMEEHKHRVLLHFLKRSGKSVEPFFESLREVAHKLEDSYDKLDPQWKKDAGSRFLELMITDGCFMLEIMRAARKETHDHADNDPEITRATRKEEKHDYAANDPIFSRDRLRYIAQYICRDMLLLENQLPMLVLHQLVTAENDGKEADDEDINKLILGFCIPDTDIKGLGRCLHVIDVVRKGLLKEPKKVQHEQENVGCLHVIDVVRKGLLKEPKKGQHKPEIIRSATELNEAGIRFKMSDTDSLKDISFDRCGGVLSLPVITVEDTTESMLRNIMTFERLHIGAGNEVTSYVIFMDNIINNEQDVALLHAQGVIQNDIGSDKAVAELFNSLCKEVTLPSDNSLETVQQNISKHCEKHWNKWRAILNRDYFGSPWTILSLIAAIFLFALTIIQTVYIVLSYY